MLKEQDIAFYKEKGYFLAKGVFSKVEVDQLRFAVDSVLQRAADAKRERNAAWSGDFLPAEQLKKLVVKGMLDLQYHDAAFTRAAVHPRMADVLSALIGPNVQLHHTKLVMKPPEQGGVFPMHQDYPYFPHSHHTMLAASVHLDDADEENGCIRVIPGSHKSGTLEHVGRYYLDHREYTVDMGIPLPAAAGDVLFFNYLTIHGSKANLSARPRRNILFQYRDPEDAPTRDVHVNWGQGLMVCGSNPVYRDYSDSSTFAHRQRETTASGEEKR